jgi:peptidoglycan hydrolase CwlO-like protein
VNPGDRRIVTVTVLLLGLGLGSLTMWIAVGTRADAAVVSIVHREQQPLQETIEGHTKQLESLQDDSKEFRKAIAEEAVGQARIEGKIDTLLMRLPSRK